MTQLQGKTFAGKRLAFTGGGSAGHVVPLLPLMEDASAHGAEIRYMGSVAGIEKSIIAATGIPYIALHTTKLRRSFTISNLAIPWRLVRGIRDAIRFFKRYEPDVLISKGGFVSVPAVIAAWLTRVPIVSHESDLTTGLANRIALPFCTSMCTALPLSLVKGRVTSKHVFTGIPIRREFVSAKKSVVSTPCKPTLLVFGGSLGASAINTAIRAALPSLVGYRVVHICGRGNIDTNYDTPDYIQHEFVTEGIATLMQEAEVVLCRAGMTSILELLYLEKPAVLVPLGKAASRGDQLDNAKLFEDLGIFQTLREEAIATELLPKLQVARERRIESQRAIQQLGLQFSTAPILRLLVDVINSKARISGS
ncbi:UDP-N-acetylglucosamine--N-acetylmuramyl-(pentapeptide) pyrophosphoryl-undecaprenol N-acetylglucosamine transferase [Burkholderia gladioli]|uniref:UDP-N-acetylglucosamine--N-acetylmuramyl- (pentapeptide) pyrophosphoryl-undecaprenol N-acetylglucosamine transferase n=1 Tax=Burkholderia gladioli TaxID=28095 RepID=UPI00163F343E|nr:UDP-N-acetylglucosamine--N-acetylmuramyl-(pentapeptide) pyrophosphoryl-undecaprenol N-acetylglucosamine transferase [Burkholderia gladioli]